MKLKLVLAAACASMMASPALAADPNLARNLAATCANCHGTNGHAVDKGMEALAGVPAEKLMDKLMAYRTGAKPASIMHQISKGYSETQLQLVADYFASQKSK